MTLDSKQFRSLGHKGFLCFLMAMVFLFQNCQKNQPLFQSLPSTQTGINFVNLVAENDSINVLDYMNIYTGAGVAAGDVNNDGLMDLFFSGNRESCRLYLNKGGFKFEDVTEMAGIKTDRWCTGVSMVDINQDGWLDIYVCVSGSPVLGTTANLLFINQGKTGAVAFVEQAADYGIADASLIMNASFFDYDQDNDLDLFLITNPADQMVTGVNNVTEPKENGKGADILYRNEGNGHFTDVSEAAGITKDGYSLGAAIADFNQDGFSDIFVSNDFLSSDILYLNNGDGTFTDRIHDCVSHSSFASMGNDAADINNDGLVDLFTLDMLPEDHLRRKMLIPPVNIDKFELALAKGYVPQYTRNTLQLNRGSSSNISTGTSATHFSEIALLSGVSATDWSWASLFADFDLDGDKDLLVTNGFFRDLGNLDYINYQYSQRSPMGSTDAKRAKKLADIKGLESAPLQDYLFENKGNLSFSKRSDEWGFTEKGFSNGACFADLDNDGDLEIVINQYNSTAKIYKNNAFEKKSIDDTTSPSNNFLTLNLIGNKPNIQAIGAKVWVYLPDKTLQFQALNPTRGYESSVDPRLHFGLGHHSIADSVVIVWPDGTHQVEKQVRVNQILNIKVNTSTKLKTIASLKILESSLFSPFPLQNIDWTHLENNFIDFKHQILLPHQHSKDGPAIAVGDVNHDSLEDLYVSGAKDQSGVLLIQTPNGGFLSQKLSNTPSLADETAALFFDADGDQDLDLYIGKGGSEYPEGLPELQDELWINNGEGRFELNKNAVPDTKNAGSCVLANDFDRDGDLDLFIGGRVKAGSYPQPPRSILLKNEGGVFTDVTPDFLKKIGMVTDGFWSDLDKNGFDDLVLVGEFMPITVLKNTQGRLAIGAEIENSSGWWSAISAADFDQDGDLDIVAGNLGLNSRYKASPTAPLSVFVSDFDKNGSIDPIFCHFEGDKRFIFPTRDELVSQIPAMKKRFPDYASFAKNTFGDSFRSEELKTALEWKATCFESSYFENTGQGNFKRHPLPILAQFAPIQSILIEDFNRDGHLDILSIGNAYGTEYSTGRYDASTGCLMIGDSKGGFKAIENRQSGFWADRDARTLVKIKLKNGKNVIFVGNNNSNLQTYTWN